MILPIKSNPLSWSQYPGTGLNIFIPTFYYLLRKSIVLHKPLQVTITEHSYYKGDDHTMFGDSFQERKPWNQNAVFTMKILIEAFCTIGKFIS